MKTDLISKAVGRRLDEVRERVRRLDPQTFGENGLFAISVKEAVLDQPDGVSKMRRFTEPEEWAAADSDCLTSLKNLALHGPKTMPAAPYRSADEFVNQLKAKTAAREPILSLLAERYAWPLNFSFHSEDSVREYLLMRLMTADRARIENNSNAVNTDDLLLKLNLIAVHASTATDLRFLDALNYYYELPPATLHCESQHAWLLVSWLALYARALNSWS